ncbi:chromosomal replication initiator protein DnaA [Corynebacterium bovis]|uniref:chromosomal replication initiator protein DnaA n=5 Tax=Corynebacterium bovis TaxID=36808 RepID=UPI000F6504B1|nr:chromosomal replication initiator protein DnaA [Corynebacterium bovis]RRO92394.1 chromosomal replication initiator protein DnaA [Corynebacterium bovis]RRQ14000.1 chromosomal replication initiator protein DnaA [Corynebacterium bovis]RRQ15521.1 chromosomal replication initiator protein DnaA [Corynebacterium bovis]
MTAPDADFPAVWAQLISRWLDADPGDPEYPALAPRARSVLRQITPVVLVNGIAVLTTPNQMAKSTVESRLATDIKTVLGRVVGTPVTLSLSVHQEPVAPGADAEVPAGHPGDPGPAAQGPAPSDPTRRSPAHGSASDPAHAAGPAPAPEVDTHLDQHRPDQHRPAPGYPDTHPDQQRPTTSGYPEARPDQQRPASPGYADTRADQPGPAADGYAPADYADPRYADTGYTDPGYRDSRYDAPAYGDAPAPRTSATPPPAADPRPRQDRNPAPAPSPAPREWQRLTAPGYGNVEDRGRAASNRGIPRRTDPAETLLNPKYTFETFVTGSSNQFANAACRAVAEQPARAYNPLFIWGESGLGKTHLLHAIGHYAQELYQGLRVRYVSSEELTNDYINSIRDENREAFKRRYRNLDMLIVDDIQFLQGKESTQEEFFHTFNALYQSNKQIVLSSDRPPWQLTTLEDRLRTRFEGGLITDVQTPELETRMAILSKKAQMEGNELPDDVLELIASRYENSIRELEGALVRVLAKGSLEGVPITREIAALALKDHMPEDSDVEITAQMIIEVVTGYFDLTVDELVGKGKTRKFTNARQIAMYLCRELTDLSLPKIGAAFGGRDHTTAMHAERKIRGTIKENRKTFDQVQELTQRIKARARQ